jgi:hypothetical protein
MGLFLNMRDFLHFPFATETHMSFLSVSYSNFCCRLLLKNSWQLLSLWMSHLTCE